jgi:hypothetical protein
MCEKKRNWLFRKLPCGRLIKLDVDVFYQLQDKSIGFSEKKKKSAQVILFLSKSKEPLKTIALARYILKTPKGLVADHINRDIFDNRGSNLRNVNYRQNALNRSCHGCIGVAFIRSSKRCFRYKAQHWPPKGKRLSFSVPVSPAGLALAAFARDKFVLQCGDEDYAPLNFPFCRYEPFKTALLQTDLNEFKRVCNSAQKKPAE